MRDVTSYIAIDYVVRCDCATRVFEGGHILQMFVVLLLQVFCLFKAYNLGVFVCTRANVL